MACEASLSSDIIVHPDKDVKITFHALRREFVSFITFMEMPMIFVLVK